MDNNIVQSVYDSLDASTAQIATKLEEFNRLGEEAKSGRYSQQGLHEIYEKQDTLRGEIQNDSKTAINTAKSLVAQYRADSAERNNLNPAELTDDVKLLQSGIILRKNDIQGMLKRNASNRTMTQIILRYAEEHGIDTGVVYNSGDEEEATAKNLEGILYYYGRWIDKPNAKSMLNRFFNVDE